MYIRFIEKRDIEQVLNIYKYYIINTSFSFEYAVPTIEEFTARVNNISSKYTYLVAVEGGEGANEKVVGFAYLTEFAVREAFKWSATCSVYIEKDCRGKGIGKRLYEELCSFAKQQNLYHIYALITYPNDESEKFHQKMGFVKIATLPNIGFKLEEWHGLMYYKYEVQPIEETPKPFLTINNI
ncbi:hypothetical protein AN639_02695 [Candidatus Epulonipiscium fishelsonii]|uniref:Uncharacterized protein n=1 Tax=Candidatus Epulonipiscium fishelsonii TaxID=77094 RepID=A0ACC8XFY9_9FIRM|nr:hypothetical protein AN639_02695 [Epulopiscium sp. SCG-B05WGA-EpuloA1]ONI42358.1 hypothetical protein AN396_01860 [Epulopiscium sp. SCG-B11WGA-EpuloA1]